MTDDEHLEKIREAVQDWLNHDNPHAPLVITDLAIGYAAINLHTANTGNHLGYTTLGPRHSTLGLAHILTNGLTRDDIEGDDE